jgi:hypothetical protein
MRKPQTAAEQRLADAKIDETLTNAGLPITSRLRTLLDSETEIVDTGRELTARILHNGRDLSHSERLKELSQDAMFKGNFPAEKPTVDKRDLRTMSENFDAIASGKIKVT